MWDRLPQALKNQVIQHIGFDKTTLTAASLGLGKPSVRACQQGLFTNLRFNVNDSIEGRLNGAKEFLRSRSDLSTAVKNLVIACEEDPWDFQRGKFLGMSRDLVGYMRLQGLEIWSYIQTGPMGLNFDNDRLVALLKLAVERGVKEFTIVGCAFTLPMWYRCLSVWDNLELLSVARCSTIEGEELEFVRMERSLSVHRDFVLEVYSCDNLAMEGVALALTNVYREGRWGGSIQVIDDSESGSQEELKALLHCFGFTQFVWTGFTDGVY
ncbi:hypothetical protein VKT23_014041 [Stygiomarasmius scandens]|uniref:Uncharacterized protein n=1 Tax=Marasmiellus scandens TaxID=2682957 RepID=A0ABR1J2D1_9AGAR